MDALVGYGSDSDESDSNQDVSMNEAKSPKSGNESDPNDSLADINLPMPNSDEEMEVETNPDAASEYSCQLRRLSREANLITCDGGDSESAVADGAGQNIEIVLPPAPVGKVDPKSTARLAKLAEDHRRGLDFNFQIRSNKSYRNPSIYNKLVEFFGIEEGGSNFPKDVFDPRAYKADKKHSYKEIALVQQTMEDKRQEELKKRTKIDFAKGSKSSKFEGPPVVTSKTKSSAKSIPAVGALAKDKSRSRK